MALAHYPLVFLIVSFVTLLFSAWIGAFGVSKLSAELAPLREELAVVQGATLTLLGLIIAFTFSMALNRYDLRKNYEEAEANAIGTEYVRVGLLPQTDAAKVRVMLQRYLDQRILFYTTDDDQKLEQVNAGTARLQDDLWSAVQTSAAAEPTPVMALVVSGMNDVLNTQGYTQAAWLNRIPSGAWRLMTVIAVFATLLVGMGTRSPKVGRVLLVILPLILSVAVFLIADLDSPRRGLTPVIPQNLQILSQSLHRN
jgi:hypothetical protein